MLVQEYPCLHDMGKNVGDKSARGLVNAGEEAI